MDRDDGGAIEYAGEYIEIVPHRRLAFTLLLPRVERTTTRVTVAIASLNSGSRLNLIHENVPDANATYINDRWMGILYGLGVTLPSDDDPGIDEPSDRGAR